MSTPFGLANMEYFLRQFAGREIFYWPNVGNAGDSLIAAGTYQAFRRANVKPAILENNTDVVGKIVIFGGGGNLVPLYAEMRAAIERYQKDAQRIIVLPHTIRGNETLLRDLPKSAVVFCRDPVSYAYVVENTEASVYLDHDMAFHLNVEEFDLWCRRYPDAPALFAKRRDEVHNIINARNGEAHFLRRDGERAPTMKELDNTLDLSTTFEFGTWPDNAEKSVYCVFAALRSAARIVTDRLHVGVASGLLGIDCALFDNNYGKNRGIYYHSIRQFCPSVCFSDIH
jgi:exopolysaccharide biosynthesis predicted pyruvyltransferase EpsI